MPLLLGGRSSGECECCVKYFLMQAIGSILVLGGALVNIIYLGLFYVGDSLMGEISSIIVSIGLMVKMGLVPFHFWVPRVMSGVSWEACFILRV